MEFKERKQFALHDYVSNKYRDIASIYRTEGFETTKAYLRETPLPSLAAYEAGIATGNDALRHEVARAKEVEPEKVEKLEAIIGALNTVEEEATLKSLLADLRELL